MRRLSSLAAVAALVLMTATAQAQVKPFAISGGGGGDEGISVVGVPTAFDSAGLATHLGGYTSDSGVFQSLSVDFATGAGTFRGSITFDAANGDQLACTFGDTSNGAAQPGQFQIIPLDNGLVQVVFLAEFNPDVTNCTGRFSKVVGGSFLMLAVSTPFPLIIDNNGFTPPFDYSWVGTGSLEFRTGKK